LEVIQQGIQIPQMGIFLLELILPESIIPQMGMIHSIPIPQDGIILRIEH
jgi:hypothetical protein